MIGGILTGTPVWVWPVLVGLVFVGLRATQTRLIPVWLIYALPVLGVLSVRALIGLSPDYTAWCAFLLSYLGGMALGLSLGRRLILGREGNRIRLVGEWLTLVQVLAIFAMNFVTGVLRAVAPNVVETTAYPIGFALVAGLAAGLFAGRALAAWRA